MASSWTCVQHHLLEVPTGGQLFVFLHCAKFGLDGRRYGNRKTQLLEPEMAFTTDIKCFYG